MPAPGPHVADGQLFVYRLFDVADSIDLAAAERVAAAPKSRLALEGIYEALGQPRSNFCDACFSGEYLIPFPARTNGSTVRVIGA